MVCGQRQVGKSTMLNHIKEQSRKYVSLADRNARRLAHNDPDLFFETYGYPIIINEFQKEPTILEKIKDIVDKLSYDDIAKSIGISAPTAKAWVSILERSGIIFILRPYYNKITDRLVKTPKVYFMDTGLAAYLCRWPNYEVLANGNMDGAFLETFVVSEIVKSYYNNGKPVNNLYYYIDIDKKEIDLLVITAESIYPIEIKKNKTPNHPDKNFPVLKKFNLNIKPGLIICLSDELIPYNKNCWYCPVSLI